MRIFNGCGEAAKEIERDLVELGVKVHPETMQDLRVKGVPQYETKELISYGYSISGWFETMDDWAGYFNLNRQWAKEELTERLSGLAHNPGTAWKLRSETWQPFLHHGKFAYTYAERFAEQLQSVFTTLNLYPNTRQAVLTVYDQHDDLEHVGGRARIPCSMHYQFLIRPINGEPHLTLLYVMRSSDLYTHFGYDVLLAMGLQAWMAQRLDVKPGLFHHLIGSLHAYRKDYEPRGIF
jgi:thymidylate synthase